MTNVADRDFSTFELGDNVYYLAEAVIPETAERLGMKLSTEPNIAELGELVGRIGSNKVLRENEEVTAIARDTQVDLVERSGVQNELSRSLRDPKPIDSVRRELDAVVLTGAVANWQDRMGAHLSPRTSDLPVPVYYVAGNRSMKGPSEINNANVRNFEQGFGRYPTEFEYAANSIIPLLGSYAYEVMLMNPNTGVGDEIAAYLFETHPELLEKRLVFARVANAGIQLAVQMRKAAQLKDPQFDSDPDHPQVYIATDTFPLARNAEQEADSAHYQKAGTALRQMALTAKMLHEAAGGE